MPPSSSVCVCNLPELLFPSDLQNNPRLGSNPELILSKTLRVLY